MLINANALTIPLADESVHSVVTSPPYWGLRDYGLEPIVWGGNSDCRHKWVANAVRKAHPDRSTTEHDPSGAGVFGDRVPRGTQPSKARRGSSLRFGETCSRCGAWRGSLGLEPTPEMFIDHMVLVFREVWRVLRPDGSLWLNIGDSYATDAKGPRGADASTHKGDGDYQYQHAPGMQRQWRQSMYGLKKKDLVGIPWLLALALRADGWYLRRDIIWHKPNITPESVTDRPTTAHEYLFILTKSPIYFYDAHAIREPQTGNAHSRGDGITPKTVDEKESRRVRANRSFHSATAGSAHRARRA